MTRTLSAGLVALALLTTAPPMAHADKVPDTWDDLIKVKSKRLEAVYLLPNADFRPYTKVMLDPTEVAFQKDWQRNYNSSQIGLGGRIDDAEAQKLADQARTGFEGIFAKAYTDAGYQVVTTAGPDVLGIATAIINLSIVVPDDNMSAGMTTTYSADAGEATLVVEVRDSVTGAVLGRAVDEREAGDTPSMRTSASNRADFERLYATWAKASVNGLAELKALSPINSDGQPAAPPAQ